MITAPKPGTEVAFHGWASSASKEGKVWAIYQHPTNQKYYVMHGKYKPHLEGVQIKGPLPGKDVVAMIDAKKKKGYRKHAGFRRQLEAVGFKVGGGSRGNKKSHQGGAKSDLQREWMRQYGSVFCEGGAGCRSVYDLSLSELKKDIAETQENLTSPFAARLRPPCVPESEQVVPVDTTPMVAGKCDVS